MSASTSEEPLAAGSLLPTTERRQKLRKKRALRDGISRYGVGVSGIGVIIALALIFVYLFYETFPLLKPVSVGMDTEFTVVGDADSAPSLHLVLDRFEQIGGRFSETGAITFFDASTGVVREQLQIPAPEGHVVTSFGRSENRRSLFVYGFSDGSVLPVKLDFTQVFVAGQRQIRPALSFPLGEEPIRLGTRETEAYSALAVIEGRGGYIVAGGTDEGYLAMALFSSRANLMTGAVQVRREDFRLPSIGRPVRQILANESLRNLFAIDDRGQLFVFDIVDRNNPFLIEEVNLVGEGVRVTAAQFLVGSRSLIVGGSDGTVSQWFLVRDEEAGTLRMARVRTFQSHSGAVTFIEPEYLRKGFLTGDATGTVGLHYATSG
jgi:phosphate transport system permease protein